MQSFSVRVLLTRRHHETTKKYPGPTGVHICLSVKSPWPRCERECVRIFFDNQIS